MGAWDFVKVVRGHLRLIVAATVTLTLVALIASALQPAAYSGQATVLITQENAGASLLGSRLPQLTDAGLQRDVQTQVDVMQSRGLLDQVIRSLKLDTTPADLAKRITVTSDGQTNIVTIAVTDSTPDGAAETANALASAYVAWSRDRERASIQAAVADLEGRLSAAQEQIVEIQGSRVASDAEGARQVKLQAANALYTTIADQLEQLRINEQLVTGSGSVLASAVPDPTRVSPKPLRNGALGLAMGLLLGLAMAFIANAMDKTIKSAEEAGDLYEQPVLTIIPLEKRTRTQERPGLTIVEHPVGSGAEAYRVLRNNLGFINFQQDIKAVLITSAAPSEGKSTVAANLSAVLANAGKRVVLVICDFHRPAADGFFGLDPSTGLSDVLSGRRTVADVLKEPKGFENLWVIPAGSLPPNPSELLGSSAMKELISQLRASYDWVILDSSPLLAVADTAAMAHLADGALIAVRANASARDAAQKAREQLDRVGARVLGIAFWGLEEASDGGSYYSGYRGPQSG